jgi:hypothetical protein
LSQQLLPQLEVRGPDGQHFTVEILKDRVTIGRFPEFNDVALSPDPQQLVTRKAHCAVERDSLGWWVVDNGAVNKTFLLIEEELEVVYGRALIIDKSVICILGHLSEDGRPTYWELTFLDPLGTRAAITPSQTTHLEYDWQQARLYRTSGSKREEIRGLRPQEQKLVRYMDGRNKSNRDVPIMCTYEEMIGAVWDNEAYHTEVDINHLVYELRRKLEIDPQNPQFLETVRGLGYRLVSRPRIERPKPNV